MSNALLTQFRNMDQTFQIIIQAGKRAELGQMGDRTLDQLAFFQLASFEQPGIRKQLTDRQANALAFLIDRNHLYLDLLAYLQRFVRMLDAFPTDLRQVNQAISAVNIDKSTKISQAGHTTGANIAILKLIQQTILNGLAGFLQG